MVLKAVTDSIELVLVENEKCIFQKSEKYDLSPNYQKEGIELVYINMQINCKDSLDKYSNWDDIDDFEADFVLEKLEFSFSQMEVYLLLLFSLYQR